MVKHPKRSVLEKNTSSSSAASFSGELRSVRSAGHDLDGEHQARGTPEDDKLPPPPYVLYSSDSIPSASPDLRRVDQNSTAPESRHRGDVHRAGRVTYNEPLLQTREPNSKEQTPKPGLAILLMGATGAGKSSFIASATSLPVNVGHTLDPCTVDPQSFRYNYDDGSTISLIDTPGFNDQRRPDTEILSSIINFIFANELKIISIIYLHRITERKLTGSTMLNLRLLRAMIGEHYFPNIVLVTSMWKTIPSSELDDAIEREVQFNTSPSFWGDMIDEGAKYFRWNDSGNTPAAESASKVIELCQNYQPAPQLAMMLELANGTKLEDTRAYQLLTVEVRKKTERKRRVAEDEEDERKYLQQEKAALELRVLREEASVRRELVRLEDAERGYRRSGPASLFCLTSSPSLPTRRRSSEGLGSAAAERRVTAGHFGAGSWHGHGTVGGERVDEDVFGGEIDRASGRHDRQVLRSVHSRRHDGPRRRLPSSGVADFVLGRRRH